MSIILLISDLMIPFTIIGIVAYGLAKRTAVYDSFLGGAMEGVKITFNIFPTLVGLMVAVGVLRASGTLDFIANFLAPATRLLGFPEDALPLTLMRLVSSSAATGLQLDVYATHGPDSFIGRFVSIMMSSTETVFYTLSVYFLHIGVRKTRYVLSGALFANLISIIASLVITILVFGR